MRYPTAQEIWVHLRKLDNDPANKQRYLRYIKRLNAHRRKQHERLHSLV